MSDTESAEARRRRTELNDQMLDAVEEGDNNSVTRLIQEGAEVTATDDDGDTGLHLSAAGGHKEVISTLLAHGLDVNTRGPGQMTALMSASDAGQLTCVQELLAHNADPDLQSEEGTALMRDAAYNYPDVTAALLSRGADVNIKKYGDTALQMAENGDNQDVVRMFQAWGNKHTLDQELMTAASEGKWRLVSGLLVAGADLKTRNKKGKYKIWTFGPDQQWCDESSKK